MVILLPNCDKPTGLAKGARIAALLDAMAKTLKVWPKPRLSIGAASTLDDDGIPTAESLLASADRELYLVKHSRHQGDGKAR
jgi:GGDEF domain-containing protein